MLVCYPILQFLHYDAILKFHITCFIFGVQMHTHMFTIFLGLHTCLALFQKLVFRKQEKDTVELLRY